MSASIRHRGALLTCSCRRELSSCQNRDHAPTPLKKAAPVHRNNAADPHSRYILLLSRTEDTFQRTTRREPHHNASTEAASTAGRQQEQHPQSLTHKAPREHLLPCSEASHVARVSLLVLAAPQPDPKRNAATKNPRVALVLHATGSSSSTGSCHLGGFLLDGTFSHRMFRVRSSVPYYLSNL